MGSNRSKHSVLTDSVAESLADQFFEKPPIVRVCKKCKCFVTCQCKLQDFYGEEAPLRFKMDANQVFSTLLQKIQESTPQPSAGELLTFIRDNLILDSCTVNFDAIYIQETGDDVPYTPRSIRKWKSEKMSRKFWERLDYMQAKHKK